MMSTTQPQSDLAPGIAGWQGGSGPPLLLIHGVGLQGDAWCAMRDALTPLFSVTIPDLPGHGGSAPLPGAPELADYTAKLAPLARNSVVIGHSMGALIALDLAIRHPESVSTVVALNAVFQRDAQAARAVQERAAALETEPQADPGVTLARWFGATPQGVLAQASAQCRAWLTSVDPSGYAAAYRVFAHSDGPAANALRESDKAMLFLTGGEEPNSTPAMSRAMAQLAPRGRCRIIEKARHMMLMTHPKEVVACILEFLQDERVLNDLD